MIVVLADKGIVCYDCRIVPWWMHHPEPSLLCDPNKRNQPKPNQLVLPGNQANETNRNQTNETNQMNQMNQMNQISFNSWKLRHELFIRPKPQTPNPKPQTPNPKPYYSYNMVNINNTIAFTYL